MIHISLKVSILFILFCYIVNGFLMDSELSTQPSELGNCEATCSPLPQGILWEKIIMERNTKYSWLRVL